MSRRGASVLVTGAAGFIGSHLVETLVRRGETVRALIQYGSFQDLGALTDLPSELLDRVDVRFGDLLDSTCAEAAVDGCHTVYHLAAIISVPYSFAHPRHVVDNNVGATLNLLEALRRLDPRARLVHLSSSEVYGAAEQVPLDESSPLAAHSPYAASKIAADALVHSYTCSFGLATLTVRPFNTYGPRQSTRALVPAILDQLRRGPTVALGALDPRRDLVYVADTVDGLVAAALASELDGSVVVLGTGRSHSVREVVERCVEVTGRRARVVQEQRRHRPGPAEIPVLLADPTVARERLGWSASVDLDEGVRRTWAWLNREPAGDDRPVTYAI